MNSHQEKIVYGPVFSRRLGRSFGVNLFCAKKVCSYNCVYCELGKTLTPTFHPSNKRCYPKEVILDAVEKSLNKPRTIQHLTLSGNGEPTLHPDFYDIVLGIREMIDQLRPEIKFALLTNGTRSSDQDIQEAYQLVDTTMIKLDAGDPETFEKINRPVPGFDFDNLLNGLKQTPNLILQCCLMDGDINNVRGKPYNAWIGLLKTIDPEKVYLYTIERPISDQVVKRVPLEKLLKIQCELQDLGVQARAYDCLYND